MVACKLLRWSWKLTDEQCGGLTSRQFVRYGLLRLQLGNELTGLTYGGKPRGLASVEEILARFPELTPPASSGSRRNRIAVWEPAPRKEWSALGRGEVCLMLAWRRRSEIMQKF